MSKIIGEIHLDSDATLTVLLHKDKSVSWQLDICATDDLCEDDGSDPVKQCKRRAARFLASIIKDLEQDIVA